MASLAEWQRCFIAALSNHETDVQWLPFIAGDAKDAQRRFGVYRNNRHCNLCNALRATYPVVERLVGADFFNQVADGYIDAEPSRSGNLDDYGAGFAQFIRELPVANDLPYLGDVAALEWLIDIVRNAPDVADDELVVRPFASRWPVHRIWQCNQPGVDGDTSVSLDEGEVCLAVIREARPDENDMRFEIALVPLPRERYELLLRHPH